MRIYKDVKHNSVSHWIALAKDILGRAALAESAYSEAENWFQECAALSQRLHYLLDAADYCQNLACLGFAALGLGKTSQAQDFSARHCGWQFLSKVIWRSSISCPVSL